MHRKGGAHTWRGTETMIGGQKGRNGGEYEDDCDTRLWDCKESTVVVCQYCPHAVHAEHSCVMAAHSSNV